MRRLIAGIAALVAACQQGGAAPDAGPTQVFDAIAADEVIFLTGTEPFWGGEIDGKRARYTTPENQDGTSFPVERFAGNNGLGFTGSMDGVAFDLTVTPGKCSDGMSDRTYPYTATLRVGEDQREGCAWTNAEPFSGLEKP